MFAVRKLVRVAPPACRLAVQQRSFMAGPPRVRISFAEKVAHGTAISLAIISIPLWVLSHLSEYKGAPEPEDDD